MGKKITAIVKWFDNKKGFGFAKPVSESGDIDQAHDDIFIHHSEVAKRENAKKDFVVLHEGEIITCECHKSQNGYKAVKVTPKKYQFEVAETQA